MKTTHTIAQITRQWKNRIGLLALATAVLCISSVILVGFWSGISLVPVAIISGLILFLIFWFIYQVYPNQAQTIRLIDAQFPSLEYSSQLSQAEDLQGLALLQQQKI